MMNVRPIAFAVVVATVTGHDDLGFTRQACAQSITAATYNIKVAVLPPQIDEFINIRRHLIFESIMAKQPDFMGFQEAYARTTNSEGVTQQTALGQLFEETKWQYYSWEAENEFNMNPIIVNTNRLNVVAFGVFVVDFEEFLGPEGWMELHDLHEFFHGPHFLGPERYVNWVVADDIVHGGRAAFLTSHYETFIGWNNQGPEYDKLFQVFSDLVNSCFGYASQQIVTQAELLKKDWGALEAIIGGDFETPDPELPSQMVFEDAGYAETWRYINGNGQRPTLGIDNMFVMPNAFTINDSYYDQAPYTNDASDHKPLYAEVTLIQILCAADLNSDGIVDTSDLLELFAQWGTAGPADFDGNGVVNTADLLILFANWGPCK